MAHGNYGSGREPVLTDLERVALTAAHEGKWAAGQVTNYEGNDDMARAARENSSAYMRGFRDAMKHIGNEIDRMKATPNLDTFTDAIQQLRLVEIELAGWMERADVPADVAQEMSDRLQQVMRFNR